MDIHIITGHLGSGKTEVAVNFALQMANHPPQTEHSPSVAVVDIDVVNPYFAAREARASLEAEGITVAAPSLATTTADVPVLSGEIYQVLHQHYQTVILDVGGDPAGARILGSLHEHLRGHSLHVYCVVNTKRPSTSDLPGIMFYIDQINAASRLAITGFIHNSHLLNETSVQDVCDGQALLDQVSQQTGIPIVLTATMQNIAQDLEGCISNDVLSMQQYIKPPYVL